jgi:hypothetical protein
LVSCLTKRLQAEKKGNVAGRTVSDDCVAKISEFKIDRSNNINKDVPLGARCCFAAFAAALLLCATGRGRTFCM